jgi:hypothetical protein
VTRTAVSEVKYTRSNSLSYEDYLARQNYSCPSSLGPSLSFVSSLSLAREKKGCGRTSTPELPIIYVQYTEGVVMNTATVYRTGI